MIHAKTVVADGWWSKVGSTNLNLSSLAANWEIDLVAEDRRFGAKMEEMFEEDLAHAREVRLYQAGWYPRVRPERPIEAADHRACRGVVGSGSGASATIARVGSTVLQKSGAPVNTYENALAAVASAALLGSSVLAARFPRFVAWPLGAAGGLLGEVGVLRAARLVLSDDVTLASGPDHPEPGTDKRSRNARLPETGGSWWPSPCVVSSPDCSACGSLSGRVWLFSPSRCSGHAARRLHAGRRHCYLRR